MKCPLCSDTTARSITAVGDRKFHICCQCELVFLDPSQHLSLEQEKARYETHNNDVMDPRYRSFVSPIYEAIVERTSNEALGLDFGAGPGPVIAKMLEEQGYRVQKYDPFFWPHPHLLQQEYDYVFACEVTEHFSNPRQEFALLCNLLKPRAPLFIMTLMRNENTDLERWHYLRDPTHVCAYSRQTFHWIKTKFAFSSVTFISDRLIVLEKR